MINIKWNVSLSLSLNRPPLTPPRVCARAWVRKTNCSDQNSSSTHIQNNFKNFLVTRLLSETAISKGGNYAQGMAFALPELHPLKRVFSCRRSHSHAQKHTQYQLMQKKAHRICFTKWQRCCNKRLHVCKVHLFECAYCTHVTFWQ